MALSVDALNSHLHSIVTKEDYADTLIISDTFSLILQTFGSPSATEQSKSIASVIISKLFEKPSDTLTRRCEDIINKWLDSTEKQDKLFAYSALTTLFQVNAQTGANILNKEGLLEDIEDCIEFESDDVKLAMVETLSQACSHNNSRITVGVKLSNCLSNMVNSKDERIKMAASVALTKILLDAKAANKAETSQSISNQDSNSTSEKLTQLFQNLVIDANSSDQARANAIEGLAYASLKPPVKELITNHPTLLKVLFSLVKPSDKPNTAINYGIAVIMANITAYRKKLTESEEQALKLRKLAGEQTTIDPDPLESEKYVINRCKKVITLGGISVLNTLTKTASQSTVQLVAQAFLNLATDQTNRGLIVQQSGAKTLTSILSKSTDENISTLATQALAKIAISLDPRLAFHSTNASDLVRPFLNLCKSENELCQFESLMALTNLCSVDDALRHHIYTLNGIPVIENLQFSDNTLVRRAATECLCNLMFCEPVFTLYSTPSTASNRIQITLALSDVDDFETRRAASGALAILSTSPDVCQMIADRPRGVDVVLDLLNDESPELMHRAAEIFKNMATLEGAVEKMVRKGVHERLITLLKECKVESVVGTAAEALREIGKYAGLQAGDK
ncbi:11619_t:CDS:1 [Paraglomus brasilianum]|uniref:11619_t:CDS:1 n=1 Tax=Paraglomus brasilianum TaxID=144538 RepID=A0A9N8WB13_9GLOM|nr:11619_t:CDS:1 [Paraglomus brasilianum]